MEKGDEQLKWWGLEILRPHNGSNGECAVAGDDHDVVYNDDACAFELGDI